MPVQCPPPTWPAALQEEGPAEDPTILLAGPARFGNAAYRVIAVRVDPERLHPDFRPELDESVYAEHELQVLLDELVYFGELGRDVVVTLESGGYVMLMTPQGGAGQDRG